MINISVLDFKSCDILPQKIPEHQNDILARIAASNDENLRRERLVSYSFLLYSYKKIYGEEPPKLVFSEAGKPSLLDGEIRVSLSHTDGFCAVAFAKRDVGVDIEMEERLAKNSHAIARFVNESVQKSLISAEKAEASLEMYVLKNGEFYPYQEKTTSPERENASHLWCALEAVLKCKEGFESYPHLSALCSGAEVFTATLGCGIIVSAAEMKD